MMTPQEAEARVFTKASFGGYNIQQVDNFLDTLLEDYGMLYQENASLKSKMKLLVDKIEEYRATEDAMRRALHSAQQMADEMIKEGEAKRDAAIASAQEDARREKEAMRQKLQEEEEAQKARIQALQQDVDSEQARLEAARASTVSYVARLKELYAAQLEYIGGLSSLAASDPPPQGEAAPAAEKADPAPQAGEEDLARTRVFDQIKFHGGDDD